MEHSSPGESGWTILSTVMIDEPETHEAHRVHVRRGPFGELGAVWTDDRDGEDFGHGYFSYSVDAGGTWSEAEQFDPDLYGLTRYPCLTFAPDGTVLVAWEDSRNQAEQYRTWFRKRTPVSEPRTWSAPQFIATGSSAGPAAPMVTAIDRARYTFIWTDYRLGPSDNIYFKRSDDGGVTWSGAVQVSSGPGVEYSARWGTVVVDASDRDPMAETMYCACSAWRGDAFPDVWVFKSEDGGQSWDDGVQAADITYGFQQVGRFSLDQATDGTLCVVWYDYQLGSQFDVRAACSTTGGALWSSSVKINPDLGNAALNPTIAARGNQVVVACVWKPVEGLDRAVFRNGLTNGGAIWGPSVCVMDDCISGVYSLANITCDVVDEGVVLGWDMSIPGVLQKHVYLGRADRAQAVDVAPMGGICSELLTLRVCPNPVSVERSSKVRIVFSSGGGDVSARGAIGASGIVRWYDSSGRLAGAGSVTDGGGITWHAAARSKLPAGVYSVVAELAEHRVVSGSCIVVR